MASQHGSKRRARARRESRRGEGKDTESRRGGDGALVVVERGPAEIPTPEDDAVAPDHGAALKDQEMFGAGEGAKVDVEGEKRNSGTPLAINNKVRACDHPCLEGAVQRSTCSARVMVPRLLVVEFGASAVRLAKLLSVPNPRVLVGRMRTPALGCLQMARRCVHGCPPVRDVVLRTVRRALVSGLALPCA